MVCEVHGPTVWGHSRTRAVRFEFRWDENGNYCQFLYFQGPAFRKYAELIIHHAWSVAFTIASFYEPRCRVAGRRVAALAAAAWHQGGSRRLYQRLAGGISSWVVRVAAAALAALEGFPRRRQ
jgi:hypothetical protein